MIVGISREEILRRFEKWLDGALAAEEPPRGIEAEILETLLGEGDGARPGFPDAYSLWAAMTALAQEIKLQGRSFKELNATLGSQASRVWPNATASDDAARNRAPLPQGSPWGVDRSARSAWGAAGIGPGRRGVTPGCRPAKLVGRASSRGRARILPPAQSRRLEERIRAGARSAGSNSGRIQCARNPLPGAAIRSAADERDRSSGIECRSRRHGDRGLPQRLRMEWRSVSTGAGEGFVRAGREKENE